MNFRLMQTMRKLQKNGQSHSVPPLLVSFDVFETLLVRSVATPEDVNRLLARRLRDKGLSTLSDEAFMSLRRQAEHRAMQANSSTRESQTTLHQIADEMSHATGLPLEQTWKFVEEELELEGELLRALPGAAQMVEKYRKMGARIVYISDMYLPSDRILSWLIREGIARDKECIYLSGELGISKGTGRLFTHVLEEQGVQGERCLHVGNNHHADVQGARRAGIPSLFVARGNLTRYEKNLAGVPGGWGGALAGTSRLVRLEKGYEPDGFEAAAAGVVAPMVVSYVTWLLHRAKERGVDRLLFLSRDGLLPFRLAQHLAPRMGIDIPMTYIYASRRTWGLAALQRRSASSMAWVLESSTFLSIRSCLGRAGLVPEAVEDIFASAGFPRDAWERNLEDDERQQVAAILLENPRIGELLDERQKAELQLLSRYFFQQSVLEGKVLGLVDLGWHGTLQQAFRDLLDGPLNRADIEIEGYYVGINRSERFAASAKNVARGFLKDAYHGPKQVGKWHLRMGFFLETFCAADHGTLLAYETEDDRVVPVLDPRFDDHKGAGLRKIVLETAVRFSELVPVLDYERSALEQVPLSILKNVELFWLDPSRREAATWGRFPVDDRQGGTGATDTGLARPFGIDTVIDIFKHGADKDRVAWFAGAMAQTDPWLARTISLALRLDQLTRDFRVGKR